MQLDLVAWGDAIGGLALKAREKGRTVTAQAFRYSQPVSYRGPALLEIHKFGDGDVPPAPPPTADDLAHQLMPLEPEPAATPGEAGAPPKQGLAVELERRRKDDPSLVALARLPGASRRATVLLAPAGDGTYQAYVIDDDPATLPPGRLRIHNLSPLTIAMRCNGRAQKEIRTRDTFTVAAVDRQVIYELAYQVDGEWQVQENNILPVRPDEQTQLIVLRSTNQFFLSADGSPGGFLQTVVLRRSRATAPAS